MCIFTPHNILVTKLKIKIVGTYRDDIKTETGNNSLNASFTRRRKHPSNVPEGCSPPHDAFVNEDLVFLVKVEDLALFSTVQWAGLALCKGCPNRQM